jgi:hypothetical protein
MRVLIRPTVRRWPRLCVLGSLHACAVVPASTWSEQVSPPQRPLQVVLELDQGELIVRPSDTPMLRRTSQASVGELEHSASFDAGTWTLSSRCTRGLACQTQVQLWIPRETPLSVRMNRGHMDISGTRRLLVDISEGEVQVRGAQHADIRVGVGELWYEGDSPDYLDLSVSSGNIEIGLPEGPWQIRTLAAHTEQQGIHVREASGLQPMDHSLSALAPAGHLLIRALPQLILDPPPSPVLLPAPPVGPASHGDPW